MNVWVVSFDESEERTDPEFAVFQAESDTRYAVKRWAAGRFDLTDDELGMGDVSIVRYDPDTGESLAVHIRHMEVREPTVLATEVV